MDLQEIRSQIDELDTELTSLFCKRMELMKQVAIDKNAKGISIEDHAREREIIARVCNLAGEPLERYVHTLYSTLFDISCSYQRRLIDKEESIIKEIQEVMQTSDVRFPQKGVVACHGIEGSYSQMACERLFTRPENIYFKNFESVFQAVEIGLCDYGIVPIENTSTGSVNEVLDLLNNHKLYILRSVSMHIDHNLLAKKGVALSDIKEIISNEQALGQCIEFLNRHPDVKVTICENTATAAKIVAESDRNDIAAISSEYCAKIYGLNIISKQVQNSENNYTRFICIGKSLVIYPGADCVSIIVSTTHTAGSLYRLMSGIAAIGVNIKKLENRPIPDRDLRVLLYMDLEASVWDEDVIRLIAQFASSDDMFVFLGNYSEIR